MTILNLLWGFSLGGIATYAYNLDTINSLKNRNIRILTVCIYGIDWGHDIKPLKEIDAYLIPIKNRFDLSWIKKILNKLESTRPDLILVHGFNGPIIARICQIFDRRYEFICTYHGKYHPPKPSRKFFEALFNFCQIQIYKQNAKSVVAVCNYAKDLLVKRGVPNHKITIIHNGIEDKIIKIDRNIVRKRLGFDKSDFVIGTASRLDSIKGIGILIQAFHEVRKNNKNAKLLIIGDGFQRFELEQLCRNLNLQASTKFIGYKHDVPYWLSALDLFVMPSLLEYHSIGLLEAMRAELPIIATHVGGNTESIEDQVSGLLVKPMDHQSLANTIHSCMLNAELISHISAEARKRFLERFTLDQHIEKMCDWMVSCLP